MAQTEAIGYVITCPVDDWTFDARYTDGVCPVCGWSPEGQLIDPPAWYQALERLDWDLVRLLGLALALGALGLIVAHAANLTWSDLLPTS